jgi:hypothetical protein
MRSEEVVLITESQEEFQEHLAAWMADWNPPTMARAHLVERLAITTWRSKRLTRIDTIRMNQRNLEAYQQFEDDEIEEVRLTFEQLARDPEGSVARLEETNRGLKRLLAAWNDLDALLEHPELWTETHSNFCLRLQKIHPSHPAATPHFELLVPLILQNRGELDGSTLDGAQIAAIVSRLRRETIHARIAYYREAIEQTPEDLDALELRAEVASFGDDHEAQTIRRYEGQLHRTFLADLKMLISLTKSEADLVAQADDPSETAVPSEANPPEVVVIEADAPGISSDVEPVPPPAAGRPRDAKYEVHQGERHGSIPREIDALGARIGAAFESITASPGG